jgi:methyl-accepting chemotaxis protein
MSPDEINAHLVDITTNTALDEFWITDEVGHAYLRNRLEIDFTFDADPEKQPQAHVFWPLLAGEQSTIVQEARQREVDTQIFKYAGVTGIDQPRIVQVGYHAVLLDQLRQQVGLDRLVEGLVDGENVDAIWVVDQDFVTLAHSAAPGLDVPENVSANDIVYLTTTLKREQVASTQEGSTLKVAAPITDAGGQVVGMTLVYLPTERVQFAIARQLLLAAVVAAFVLAVGLLTSIVLGRRITEPVARLTAAAAQVEDEAFDPQDLVDVAARTDEIGQLARVFQRMAHQVYAREQQLKRQVQELRVEIDQVKRASQVAEITETEYFEQLRDKAQEIRRKSDSTRGLARDEKDLNQDECVG